ncbi:hypothetical protein TNCV_2745141 [Trichonephila clavipes]|nr:hypothetical protein TNCV_2745141 [Trichonephila clavipes]
MTAQQEQTHVVERLIEFKSSASVQRKCSTTTLEFGSGKKFPGRRMKRGSPTAWPPRSVDVTALKFL